MRSGPAWACSVLAAGALLAASAATSPLPALAATACTSVAASANPPTDTAPGITVAVTGAASGCPNPLYKFWIEYPNSQTWLLVQGYAANSATYTFETSGNPRASNPFRSGAGVRTSPGPSAVQTEPCPPSPSPPSPVPPSPTPPPPPSPPHLR